MALVKLEGYRCERCGHTWVPRDRSDDKAKELPTVCPSCKSPYWNKPRQQAQPKGRKK
jgi:DNA-directed RNA polymerase subunit RPC12/RpoP